MGNHMRNAIYSVHGAVHLDSCRVRSIEKDRGRLPARLQLTTSSPVVSPSWSRIGQQGRVRIGRGTPRLAGGAACRLSTDGPGSVSREGLAMQFHEPNFWHQSHAWLTPDDGSPGSGLISLGWNAGTIHLQYVGLPQLSKPAVDAISATMRDFNAQCQLLAFMHAGVLGSQRAIQEQLGSKANRAGSFTLSGYYGEGKAQAIWARLPVGEVIDAFAENGEFERLYAKAFVVFSYHLWEDFARPRIAQELGVDHNDVKSELMGEWRYLRHWLVHPHGDTERTISRTPTCWRWYFPVCSLGIRK